MPPQAAIMPPQAAIMPPQAAAMPLQAAIMPPQDQEFSIIRLPGQSLGELGGLDQILHRFRQSPREMKQVSNEAIDPLLERWTNWHEVRERRHARNSGGSTRFTPLNEDEEMPMHQMFREREESPRGLYLECNTTDWRKPHSATARSEAAKMRKRYSGYQATVSADSSDVDVSPGSRGSKKKTAQNHVISDSSGSSDDERREAMTKNRRKSSGSPTTERRPHFDGPPLAHSYTAGQSMANRRSPGTTTYTSPRSSVSQPHPSTVHRPGPTPNQNPFHSISAPVPPINTSNTPNPYAPGGPYSPNQQMPPYGNPGVQAHPRYMPPSGRTPMLPRPGSQDGKPRSPSRLSQQGSYSGRSQAKTEDERKASRAQAKKNMREGATKGILGAGALAGFLEVLEGL